MRKCHLILLILTTVLFSGIIFFSSYKYKLDANIFSAIATVLAAAVTFYVAYSADETSKISVKISERSVKISEDSLKISAEALKISEEMKRMEIMNESPSVFITEVRYFKNEAVLNIYLKNIGNSACLFLEMREKFQIQSSYLNSILYAYNNLPNNTQDDDGTRSMRLIKREDFTDNEIEGNYEIFYKDYSGNQFKTIFDIGKNEAGSLVVVSQKRELLL